MKHNNTVYAHNIREASAIAESLIAAGVTEYHARYLPDRHVYEIRYPKSEKEETTTMPDNELESNITSMLFHAMNEIPGGSKTVRITTDELESLRTRIHNLNLYLRTVQDLVPESTWETLLQLHSDLPGYSRQEAEEEFEHE